MNKSINLYYNLTTDTKLKLDEIKKAGYQEFFTGCYDKTETMTMEEQILYAKELGLNCTMIHCAYVSSELDNFWLDNEIGERVLDSYIGQIERCKGLTKEFVVHLNGSRDAIVSEVGLNRIKLLLEKCEECDMNLCVENLYSEKEIPYIFENIKHKNLKICFDTGHRNCLTPAWDLLRNYAQYVTIFHIHDNDGSSDQHKMCFSGTIDWDDFANKIRSIPNIVLSAEVKYYNDDYINTLKQNYDELCRLEKIICNKNFVRG